jgi:vacuolar protein sorting-associated protein 1
VFSPSVLDLTMVDLPGMIKVPVAGQPADIEDQIKKLIMSFITQKNALILAISAANQDIANSDALKLAAEVDPEGERTIGVVTKIDLMDEGTNALDLLQGKQYKLALGYYGVKCRSQQNIIDNMSVRDALENEKRFFTNHKDYTSRSKTLGIPYLTKRLNIILV